MLYCSYKNMKRKTTEQFIKEAKEIFPNNEYDYSEVEYINTHTPIKIKCNTCGQFYETTPHQHLLGRKCRFCFENKRKTTEQFIKEAKEIFPNNEYDYSEVEYINKKSKIKIKCNTCNKFFFTTPEHHLNKHICPYCSGKHTFSKNEVSDFIKNKFNNKFYFNLNDMEYFSKSKIKFKCNDCGYEFTETPFNLLNTKFGCKMCSMKENQSYGEKVITNFLIENKIEFQREFCFDDLLSSKGYKLRFDFYLPNKNAVIEFQGEQHYEYIPYFHRNKQNFLTYQKRDSQKREYCKTHFINEIEIKFNEDIIQKLEKLL